MYIRHWKWAIITSSMYIHYYYYYTHSIILLYPSSWGYVQEVVVPVSVLPKVAPVGVVLLLRGVAPLEGAPLFHRHAWEKRSLALSLIRYFITILLH